MSLVKDVLKTFLGWIVATGIIILIIWMPRELYIESTGYEYQPTYIFSMEQYSENVSSYLKLIFQEKSLGENKFGSPVTEDLKIFMSRSIGIISIAFFIALIVGTLKGFFDYWSRNKKWRLFGSGTTFFIQALPDFFIVLLFQVVVISLINKGFPHFSLFGYESWHNYLIAGGLLSIFPTVYFARIIFAALIKEEGLPYLVTVKSKGLSNASILWKHQFGNSVFQVIPHIPTIMLYIMSNLLIVEYLMYFRGAGLRLYEALGFAGANIRDTYRTPFSASVFEPELVIAISAVFIAIVAIIQLICKLAIYYSPIMKGGEEDE